MFIKYYILFLAMAKFKQACFAHDLSKKFHTFYTQVIFGCTRHSSNKFELCTRWHENSSLDKLKASFHCSHLSKMFHTFSHHGKV